MMPPLDACKRIMHAWKDAMSTPVSLSSVSLLKGCLLLACIAPCWSCSLKKIATSLPSLSPFPHSIAGERRKRKKARSLCVHLRVFRKLHASNNSIHCFPTGKEMEKRRGGRERRKVLHRGNKESLCRATLGRQETEYNGARVLVLR